MAQDELHEVTAPSSTAGDSNQLGTPTNATSQRQRDPTEIVPDEPQQHQHHHMNRNIRFTLFYTIIAFAGRSIWNQSVLATYVFLLTNENPEAVGFITAVMGISQLLASIPTGYVADKYRRDVMLKVASAVGLLAICFTLLEMYASQNSYTFLVVALAIWGVFWGIANTSLGALFADSIADGDRSYYFTQRSILINLGNTVGPSMALAMFFFLGDHWTVHDCAVVMSFGQAVCLPAVLLLALFSDDEVPACGQERHNSASASEVPSAQQQETNQQGSLADMIEPLLPASPAGGQHQQPKIQLIGCPEADVVENSADVENDLLLNDHGTAPSSSSSCAQQSAEENVEFFFCCVPKHRVAPVLISMADLTSGLASGMSIRYFPIFFVKRLHLSPVHVQVLYLLAPLLQACLMRSGQHFSKQYGRCQVTVAHKWIGITFMMLLVIFAHLNLPAWIICVVYVLRTAFMNSTTPLTKSVLMDNVPTHERGRWSVLESVNMFSWSGSAAFGGFLVSLHGLLFNFCVTATMQFLATLPVIALALTVNVDEGRVNSTAGGLQQQQSSVASSSEQEERSQSARPTRD
ncbi:major Facilitator Superfamily MFS [Seminavis robusta]|uniref:Major Facilitator Superfamily MFS n=1 Tax=Seminavis robusta TaxID=568900 RepID=A0A9N8EVV9_9STRA|nr:major Facilitator Superfamily MFS [Seminavis robusta]|eukprot:Sro2148_g316560.1 major Facilitator Superfamily MFS (578) ;mRNA; f:7492-9225